MDDIICYPDYDIMKHVAYYLVQEIGALGDITIHMQTYSDYEAYERNLESKVAYLVTS
ncbi:hypothetical protein [Enterococcus mediterraneensis]|uniref:hypothetical protein n=1 Tax=Enterococcus mediterraneensis TaxID=2364791 RepID=UPI0013E034DC|nr:hypothetical protein [Enterococcus mediterraneensis]